MMKRTGQTVVLSVVRKKPRALERSLDKGRQTDRPVQTVGLMVHSGSVGGSGDVVAVFVSAACSKEKISH